MNDFFKIATIPLLALPTPALAEGKTGAATAMASNTVADVVPSASGRTRQMSASGPATKYCFSDTITGSRLPKRECRTAAEWLALDIDITKKE